MTSPTEPRHPGPDHDPFSSTRVAHKAPMGWLPWVLVGLLLVLVLLAVLLAQAV